MFEGGTVQSLFPAGSVRDRFVIGSESIANRLHLGRPRKNAMCNKNT
jgi:hypothetical protein